jgi:hypothetical protein
VQGTVTGDRNKPSEHALLCRWTSILT